MSLIRETKSGAVVGFQESNVNKWFGIPYAKPPVGELRFKKPQPMSKWEGTKETTKFGSKCPQVPIPINPDNGIPQNEDCLYLNIWAPENAKKCPVIFWIYGGSFASGEGSDATYYGDSFVHNGEIIVVTFNYRVGLLGGFYNLSFCKGIEEKYVANAGIFDCIEALKWVKENIAVFGGDPKNITIMGESAGATIASTMLYTSYTKGLFKKAILESVADLPFTDRTNTFMAKNLLDAYGLTAESASALLEMTQEEIKEGQMKHSAGNALASGASCIIDGELITGTLLEIIDKSEPASASILLGTNHDEGVIFANKNTLWDEKSEKMMAGMLQYNRLTDVKKMLSNYPGFPESDARAQMFTDRLFVLPTLYIADKQSEVNSVYTYLFNYAPPAAKASGMNAYHSAEMIYVFHNLNCPLAGIIKGAGKTAEAVSISMHKAWIDFAKTGNPGWDNYTSGDGKHMVFDEKNHCEKYYGKGLVEVWK